MCSSKYYSCMSVNKTFKHIFIYIISSRPFLMQTMHVLLLTWSRADWFIHSHRIDRRCLRANDGDDLARPLSVSMDAVDQRRTVCAFRSLPAHAGWRALESDIWPLSPLEMVCISLLGTEQKLAPWPVEDKYTHNGKWWVYYPKKIMSFHHWCIISEKFTWYGTGFSTLIGIGRSTLTCTGTLMCLYTVTWLLCRRKLSCYLEFANQL